MSRERELSAYVQKYDQKLFCRKNTEGKLCIYREGYYWDTFALNEQDIISVLRLTPHYVFAITHNWSKNGQPVEWGKDKIWERLRKVDLWSKDIVSELEEQEDKHVEALDKKRRNETEDFLHEFHPKFKKTFSDVRTSNFDMSKDSRKRKEKQIK